MPNQALTISCAPARAEVFVGESLPVRTVLENVSAGAVDVVSPRSPEPPPMSYDLRAPGSGQVIHMVSLQTQFDDPHGEDVVEPMDPDLQTLQPGERVTFDHDLCECAGSESFAPGDYQLVARYYLDGVELLSAPAALRVVSPMIHHLASMACPRRQRICAAFDHLSDGGVQLLAREPLADEPEDGVFHRWLDLAGVRQLGSLALAAHTTARAEGRWLAWIQGDQAAAARPWGDVLAGQVPPLELDLSTPLLAEPGFQLPGGDGLFVAAGEAPGGAYVAWIHFSNQGGKRGSAVPLADRLPDRVLARYDTTPRRQRVHLVWGEPGEGGVRILRRSFLGDGQPDDADAELLLSRPAPLRALELHPLGPGDGAYVHALLGPDEDGLMSYFRLPLVGPDWQMEEWTFEAPEDPVDDWAIGHAAGARLPVLARAGDRLLLTRAKADPHWHALTDGAMGTTHLHLLSTEDGRRWAGWVEPHAGPCYLPLR